RSWAAAASGRANAAVTNAVVKGRLINSSLCWQLLIHSETAAIACPNSPLPRNEERIQPGERFRETNHMRGLVIPGRHRRWRARNDATDDPNHGSALAVSGLRSEGTRNFQPGENTEPPSGDGHLNHQPDDPRA